MNHYVTEQQPTPIFKTTAAHIHPSSNTYSSPSPRQHTIHTPTNRNKETSRQKPYYRFPTSSSGPVLPHSDAECRHQSKCARVKAMMLSMSTIHTPRPSGHRLTSSKTRHTSVPSHILDFGSASTYDIEDDDLGKHRILLNSAAHQTHQSAPLSSITPLPSPVFTRTATYNSRKITHSGPILITDPHHSILTPSVISPHKTDIFFCMTCLWNTTLHSVHPSMRIRPAHPYTSAPSPRHDTVNTMADRRLSNTRNRTGRRQ